MTATKLEASTPGAEGEPVVEAGGLDSLIAEARTLLAHRESPDPDTFEGVAVSGNANIAGLADAAVHLDAPSL